MTLRPRVKTTMLSFRIAPELLEELRRVADEQHRTVSDHLTALIRWGIQHHDLNAKKRAKQAAKAA